MMNKIMEFEKHITQDRQMLNDLIAESSSGKATELTDLKAEELRREIDTMEKHLADLKAALQMQTVPAKPEQIMPEQGNQQMGQLRPEQRMAQARQPGQQMRQPGQMAGQPQPGQQMGQPWQQMRQPGQPQPGQQMRQPGQMAGQPQPGQQISQPWQQMGQPGQMAGQPQPGQQISQPWQQMGQPRTEQFRAVSQVQWQPWPNPQTAVRSQKKDVEKTIGKSIMAVCASVLIFISFIFFAALVIPYLNNTIKMVLMYLVSFAFTITGGVLLIKDKNNKAFLAITGCGMGAIYISLFMSDFYFRAMSDGILYICIFFWAVCVCVLSRLRSDMFLIIGQLGVTLSVLLGIALCGGTGDTEKLLFLVIYNVLTETVFYFSHFRKEYNQNLVNHIFWCTGLFLLLFGTNAHYAKDSLQGTIASVILLLAAFLPMILSMTVFWVDKKQNVAFGILNAFYFLAAYAAIVGRFEYAMLLMLVIAVIVLAALEFRFPETDHSGKIIFQCALFLCIFLAGIKAEPVREYFSVSLFAAACLIYGFCRKDTLYKIAGLGYAVLFLLIPMNCYLQFVWGLGLAGCTVVLLVCCKEQYRTWMKVVAYLMLHIFLLSSSIKILHELGAGPSDMRKVFVLAVLTVVNIIIMKVPVLHRHPQTRKEEEGVLIETGIIQILLMVVSFIYINGIEEPIYHTLSILLGMLLFFANSFNLIKSDKSGWAGIYVGTKAFVFLVGVLKSFSAPNFLTSLAGLLIALACIIAGFWASGKNGRNFKPVRIYGLILVLLSLIKLILIDIHYDSILFRAISFFVSGVLCFGISLIYNMVDKMLTKEK